MALDTHGIVDSDRDALARMFCSAFAGYIAGEPALDGQQMADFLRVNSVDETLSRLVMRGDTFCALALITPFEGRSRLAAMGVADGERGKGVGDRLVHLLIEESAQRGDRAMVLEVIEQNTPAVALYYKHGFTAVRRLCGWRVENARFGDGGAEVARMADVVDAVRGCAAQDLPWQGALPNLGRVPERALAYNRGDSYAVVIPGEDNTFLINTLFTTGASLHVDDVVACLKTAMHAHPQCTWTAPVRFPEECGPVFDALGAERHELTQLQMERKL